VAPVLDPTWQNPYTPSAAEREENLTAPRAFVLRRRRPQLLVIGVVAIALMVGVVVSPWLLVAGLVVAALGAFDLQRALAAAPSKGENVGASMLAAFTPGGTAADRQRLVTVVDRLAATFGVTGVSAFIVDDSTYNAALVPNGPSMSLFVTNAMMRDFELIELEGVVAHLFARHRLGLLPRTSASAVSDLPRELRRSLAGYGMAYRADEVAAAAIRYPLGLAGALRKCSRQVVASSSFFASEQYDKWRFTFFDIWSDRTTNDVGDLDDVELRAMALEEW
jgi:Zn-dependent protease with chaperone function